MRHLALSEARKRDFRYGALALAVILLGAGVIFLANRGNRPTAAPTVSGPAAADTAANQDAGDDEIRAVSALRRDEAVGAIADARRQAAAGRYELAEASLQRAEKAVPKLAEVAQARADIAQLKTPEGQLAAQLQRARLALDHDDTAAAEAALSEAARVKPDAPQIAELRTAIAAEHDKKARRESRIADALARMRAAVARRDFGAADSALNEAERIDMQSPAIRRARGELARARGSQDISD